MNQRRSVPFAALIIGLLFAIALAIVPPAPNAGAATQAFGIKSEKGLGSQVLAGPVVSTALTLPTGAKHAKISVRCSATCTGVILSEDGTPASAINGVWVPPGTVFVVTNDRAYLADLRFWTDDGVATVYVSFTGDR